MQLCRFHFVCYKSEYGERHTRTRLLDTSSSLLCTLTLEQVCVCVCVTLAARSDNECNGGRVGRVGIAGARQLMAFLSPPNVYGSGNSCTCRPALPYILIVPLFVRASIARKQRLTESINPRERAHTHTPSNA